MYRSFQTPPESINYLFALARTSSQSEFFSDFGKVTKISIQTSKNHKCNFIFLFFFAFLESTLGGKSTLGVCVIAQRVKLFWQICSTSLWEIYTSKNPGVRRQQLIRNYFSRCWTFIVVISYLKDIERTLLVMKIQII